MAERMVRQELETGEPELALVPVICDRSRSFLDIGANRGVYSLYAERFAGRVIAVEAHPGLASQLSKTVKPSTQVLSFAMSDHMGSATLMVPYLRGYEVHTRASLQKDANPGFDLQEIPVELTTVDSLNLVDVGAIKIDVEGHEHEVLQGAKQTITRCKPVMIVECEERHNKGAVARMKAFFADLDYKMYFIHNKILRHGADFDAAVLQRKELSKPVAAAVRAVDYINNFIFVHKDDQATVKRITDQMTRLRA
jgi:FkbM family methyltransferase